MLTEFIIYCEIVHIMYTRRKQNVCNGSANQILKYSNKETYKIVDMPISLPYHTQVKKQLLFRYFDKNALLIFVRLIYKNAVKIQPYILINKLLKNYKKPRGCYLHRIVFLHSGHRTLLNIGQKVDKNFFYLICSYDSFDCCKACSIFSRTLAICLIRITPDKVSDLSVKL